MGYISKDSLLILLEKCFLQLKTNSLPNSLPISNSSTSNSLPTSNSSPQSPNPNSPSTSKSNSSDEEEVSVYSLSTIVILLANSFESSATKNLMTIFSRRGNGVDLKDYEKSLDVFLSDLFALLVHTSNPKDLLQKVTF